MENKLKNSCRKSPDRKSLHSNLTVFGEIKTKNFSKSIKRHPNKPLLNNAEKKTNKGKPGRNKTFLPNTYIHT